MTTLLKDERISAAIKRLEFLGKFARRRGIVSFGFISEAIEALEEKDQCWAVRANGAIDCLDRLEANLKLFYSQDIVSRDVLVFLKMIKRTCCTTLKLS